MIRGAGIDPCLNDVDIAFSHLGCAMRHGRKPRCMAYCTQQAAIIYQPFYRSISFEADAAFGCSAYVAAVAPIRGKNPGNVRSIMHMDGTRSARNQLFFFIVVAANKQGHVQQQYFADDPHGFGD